MTSKSCSILEGSANPITGSEMNSRSPSPIRGSEEGVYSNSEFMNSISAHLGKEVIIRTEKGQSFKGIFRTFSNSFEVVLETAQLIDGPSRSVVDKLIFRPQDILSLELKNVDSEFATKDTSISRCGELRDLEPWQDPGCNEVERLYDELGDDEMAGWDVNDMFLKNEQMGVSSTYDENLVGYTIKIDTSESTEFREALARANKIVKCRSGQNKLVFTRVNRRKRKNYKKDYKLPDDQNKSTTVVSNDVTGSTSSDHQIDNQAFRGQRKHPKKDRKLSKPQTKGTDKEPGKRSVLNPNAKEFVCNTPLVAPQTEPAFRMPYLPQGHLTPQPYQQQMAHMVAPLQSSAGAMVPTGQEDYYGAGPRMHQFMPGPYPHYHSHHCNGYSHGYGQETATPRTPLTNTYPMMFPPPNFTIPPPPPPHNMMAAEQGYNMHRHYRNGGPK